MAWSSSAGNGARRRVLVTGATGLLGRQVMSVFAASEAADKIEVRGLCHSRKRPDLTMCDLTQEDHVREMLREYQPHVVVHLAAERRPDVVEKMPDKTKILNEVIPGVLAKVCEEIEPKAWLLFISTDYVFDGTSPPYAADAETKPLNLYGKQKAVAEKSVMDTAKTHAILRVPLLYGPMEYLGESSATQLFQGIVDKSLKKADDLQKRYPTSTLDVAKIILCMTKAHLSGTKLEGPYHYQAKECLTKWDMVQAIGKVTGFDVSHVQADRVLPSAPRPEDSKLDCLKLKEGLSHMVDAKELVESPMKFEDGMKLSLQPHIVSSQFEKVLGTSNKMLPKEDLARVLKGLLPGLKPEEIEHVFSSAVADQMGDQKDEIAYDDFIRWVFQ